VLIERIREKLTDDDMQFGFRPGKGTTDAIFAIRKMREKHTFIGLGKTFDSV